MVRHVVMFSFREDAGPERIEAFANAVKTLPDIVSGIVDFNVGFDIGVNPGNATMAVCADFASRADYLGYRDHPEHRRIVAELGQPWFASRSAIQFEW
jgi:hypothetical protein